MLRLEATITSNPNGVGSDVAKTVHSALPKLIAIAMGSTNVYVEVTSQADPAVGKGYLEIQIETSPAMDQKKLCELLQNVRLLLEEVIRRTSSVKIRFHLHALRAA
ncbi:MAG: hypothetical protein WD883_02240 [Candidatus Colwellbacteria bacterium]